MSAVLTLYGTSNTRAFRVLWLLEELGLAYRHVKTDFAGGDTRTPEFLALNPNGHVPVLVDGELVLWESLAINLHLGETYGRGRLWPEAAHDRARAVQWSFWAMTECEAHTFAVLFAQGGPQFEKWRAWTESPEFAATHPGYVPPSPVASAAALQAPFGALERHLQARDWIVGDSFGIADLNVASVLVTTRLARMDLSAFPRLDGWLGRCTSRPALAAAARK